MVGKIYAARNGDDRDSGKGIDWALASSSRGATLLLEGNHVRISGQDVERGTFSHRHCVVHDQKKFGDKFSPRKNLKTIDPSSAAFNACNSSLSEFAVLGFELGYSLENPASLIMWEAQFGDFANTAQCMIDQFISSGEQKWLRQSGLCMMLPHGYEGQGPEHSSARLERFLQMCDDDEDEFPAILGRQSLAHPAGQLADRQLHDARQLLPRAAAAGVARLPQADGRHVAQVAPPAQARQERHRGLPAGDALPAPHRRHRRRPQGRRTVRKVVFCSGKVYFDLLAARDAKGIDDVAIARVEQIAPFPFDLVQEEIKKYPNAEVVWCQEEHKNGGAWSYVRPRIVTAARDVRPLSPSYAGRKPAASTATGYGSWHTKEMEEFLNTALG